MALLPPVWVKYKGACLGTALLLAVLTVSAIWGSRGLLHLWRLEAQQRELETRAIRLQHHNDALRDHLRRMRTDNLYLEHVIRQRLGWVKDGEILYRVPENR